MTSTHRKQAFDLLSQHLDLYVDLKRRTLRGCAKLFISIAKPAPNILIHCSQSHIKSVRVGEVATSVEQSNLCLQLVQSPQNEVCDGNTYRVFWKAAQEATEEFDLMVHLPPAAPDAIWPQQYELSIDYELVNPQGGLFFVLPHESTHPNRREHCYTVSQLGCCRMWMPCVDFPVARCTWKIDINVPENMHAVCVGELKERSKLDQQNRVKYSYSLDVPTAAHQILFAVGPFESIHDSPPVQLFSTQQSQDQPSNGDNGAASVSSASSMATNGVDSTTQQQSTAIPLVPSNSNAAANPYGVITPPWRSGVLATSHCLPGRLPLLTHTCKDTVSRAIEHLEQHLKLKFPYQSMKCVFVEAPFDHCIVGAGMLILSTHLLHSNRILDQHVKTKRILWLGMCKSWVLSQVVLRSWHDTWIENGLASYLCSTVYRHVYGLNMHKDMIWKAMNSLLRRQNKYLPIDEQFIAGGKQPPYGRYLSRVALYETNFVTPHELYSKPMLQKAMLVFHLLERKLRAEGLRKVVSNILLPPSVSMATLQPLKTEAFLKICRKTTGEDLQQFAENWIYSDLLPVITGGFTYQKKKNLLVVGVKQDVSKGSHVADNLRIRVFPPDASVFDSKMPIRPLEDDPGNISTVLEIPLSNESKAPVTRRQDEMSLATAPCDWIRIDPDLEWLRMLTMKQPLFMWINQLQKDKDIFAQMEALEAIADCRTDHLRIVAERDPALSAIRALATCMAGKDIYIGVRMAAARSLALLASRGLPGALTSLIEYFKSRYWNDSIGQWRPNNFENVSSYQLKKAIVEAVASVTDHATGLTPRESVEFLIDVLRNNDNSRNKYEDNYFMASLLNSLGKVNVTIVTSSNQPMSDGESGGAITFPVIVAELLRYLARDKSAPSYHNVMTVACLRSLCTLMLDHKTPIEVNVFRQYLRAGNFENVRREAAHCLLKLMAQPASADSMDTMSLDARGEFFGVILTTIICATSESGWLRSETARLAVLELMYLDRDCAGAVFSFPNRNAIWLALNGPTTAFDPRVRLHLSTLHLLGSNRWAEQRGAGWAFLGRLEPLPLLPTRPLPKPQKGGSTQRSAPVRNAALPISEKPPTSSRSSRTRKARLPSSPLYDDDDDDVGEIAASPPPTEPPTPAAPLPSLKVSIKVSGIVQPNLPSTPLSPKSPPPKSPSLSPRGYMPPGSPQNVLSSPVHSSEKPEPMSPVVDVSSSVYPEVPAAAAPAAPVSNRLVLNSGQGKIVLKFKPAESVNPFPNIKRLRLSLANLVWLSPTEYETAKGYQLQTSTAIKPIVVKPKAPRRRVVRDTGADDDEFVADDEEPDDDFEPFAAAGGRRSKAATAKNPKRKSAGRNRKKRSRDDYDALDVDGSDDDPSEEFVEYMDEDDGDEAFEEAVDADGNWN